ncbi:MAG: hypothetical protein LBS57_09605 [Treponema sp.]|jgi:hypothetical protein|nr:hypothetical protein [Treponema sp.]
MDLNSFLGKVAFYANKIDMGRKGFATDSEEHEGRLSYEEGIAGSFTCFQEAQASADCRTIVLTETAFLEQELQFCEEADSVTRSSLTQAIQSFADALLSLEAVDDPGYTVADKTYPHRRENRVRGFPKDAFHYACIAHRTRIGNILRSPGINMTEKAVLQQRALNMRTAQGSYLGKQERALSR